MQTHKHALVAVLVALSTLVMACADNSKPTGDIAGEEIPAQSFCDMANDFVTDQSVTNAANFSAEFFSDVDERLVSLIDAAPADIKQYFGTLQTEFAATNKALAELEYDLADPGFLIALQNVDDDAMLAATEAIEDHVGAECSIEPDPIDAGQVDDIMEAFSINRQLAECIHQELGDVANISPELLTPELLTQPVCETSLYALLSGSPAPGG